MKSGFVVYIMMLLLSSGGGTTFAQKDKKPLLDPHVRKLGPYFGVQQGRFTVGEIGMEAQFKDIRLKKTKTHAVHLGLGYNFSNNALQINSGYWHKPSRFDLTYGVDVCMRSNFEEERYGVSPVVGYKVFGFHIRAGYMLLTSADAFTATNTLFVNLRFTLVNNRNFKWNRRN